MAGQPTHVLPAEQVAERLDRLITLSKRHAWEPGSDVDWNLPAPALSREERHATAFERLYEALGMSPLPPSPIHAYFLKVLAVDQDFNEKLVIIHWLVEVYAKLLFDALKQRFPGTIVEGLFAKVLQDESRHVAFGDCYLPARLREASPFEVARIMRMQLVSCGLMGLAALVEHYDRAARVLGLDVAELYREGLDTLELRYKRFGEPAGLLNLSPWLRPLAQLIPA